MLRYTVLALLLVGAAVCVNGCVPPAGDGDTELADAQKAAVDAVVGQVVAAAKTYGLCAALSDTQLDLDSIGAIGSFGTCPTVSFVASVVSAVIQLDYTAAGCSGPATGGTMVKGAVTVQVTRATRAATIQFDELTIDDHSVTGTITVTIQARTDGVVLEGTCDVTTADVGTVVGDITIALSRDGLITIESADITVDDGTTTYAVALADVVLDPVDHGNFVPESGTVTFELEGATIVVTFLASTPTDGTVRVSVGGASAVDYDVPGLGG